MREVSATLASDLQLAIGDYGPVATLLGQQPVTLVHNDVAPKNVIVDRSVEPSRICFVDWEMAGVGCGLLDLVDLKYGLDAASDGQMFAAYREAVAGSGLLPAAPNELRRLVAACELHKTLYRLAFGRSWGVPEERLAEWVTAARRHRADL
jgi:aminoglycoside phosphotransferase (APT) family kinase protein